ncbi:MAG: isoprenyl synthetase [Bacteroidetes bacterium GWA2_30_7]|nr:MAG: isoprenyl synthetase [Bacteroidetes bacterium GWA2_30_7]
MISSEKICEIIEKEINQIDFKSTPLELYQPIYYALESGGKRIRPTLVLLACNLFSENINDAVLPALGIEIFHNFTLLHDDIMDKADLRRNRSTVHKKWSENVAILSGDAMMIKSYDFFSNLSPDLFKKTFAIFNKTALQVCEGQQFDMNFESIENVSQTDYLKMIELKTAVLLGTSLKIGATIGGADAQQADLLYDFGKNLGISFQLHDDYLDSFGNQETFGKKIGGDITANKKTFLYIKALELADNNVKKNLIELYSTSNINNENKIKVVLEVFNNLDIKNITLSEINKYHNLANKSLQMLDIDKSKLSVILSFVETLKNRIN